MTLLENFIAITSRWRGVFPQRRTHLRAQRQALGSLVCLGRRTLTRIIWTNGGSQRSWSAEYFLHSRCQGQPQQLFQPIVESGLEWCRESLIGSAVDETRLHKTGRSIEQACYQRDPMSPPFHCNLMLGWRFLQASLLLPLERLGVTARALPIRFQDAPAVKKPGRRADAEQRQQYREQRKQHNLSQRFVQMMAELRQSLDEAGARRQRMVLAADGSFCNRTVFTAPRERSEIIARARKDARLCWRAPAGGRRFYGAEKFTPEPVRHDKKVKWQTAQIFYGGQWRKIRYKQLRGVLWQGGARRQPLRLFVVAPTAYHKRKSSRLYYRRAAYLLTSDLDSSVKALLQIYCNRWQIEVNHREEKDTLGVGQAQLWNGVAVPKQPVLAVAAYSALLLAGLASYGAERGEPYAPLPQWRRDAKRPSCLDLITLLRKEMAEHPERVAPLGLAPSYQGLTAAAAA